jgi:hypothetical protein
LWRRSHVEEDLRGYCATLITQYDNDSYHSITITYLFPKSLD